MNGDTERDLAAARLLRSGCELDPSIENREENGEDDAGVELEAKATTPDATVRTVVHIIRRFSLTTAGGLVMNNDHVTASNVTSALASANTIWKRPALQSVVMNATVVEENALNP